MADEIFLELEERFNKNLQFLEKHAPEIAEKLKNFTPERFEISLEGGKLNIFDRLTNTYLYPSDAQIDSYAQVAHFLQNPQSVYYGIPKIKDTKNWLHLEYMKKLIDTYYGIFGENPQISFHGIEIPSLIFIGMGFGFHIEFFLKNFSIRNLLIIEPELELFYISLHFVDWYKLLQEYVESPVKNFSLILESDPKKVELNVRAFFGEVGIPFAVASFIYIHFISEPIKEIFQKVVYALRQTQIGLGFFDDEWISLKHSLINLKEVGKVFIPNLEKKRHLPAVVVGSGPSLDRYIDLLKEHQDKFFIISCGTALGVLQEHGIKPDLHVNIERNEKPFQAVLKVTTEDFRKEISFLGANNNYPPFFGAFGKSAFYLKANDAGALLFPRNKYPRVYFVNPTVTNTGMALAFYLGFREIYLLGVDLAFPEEKHHAKGTVYDKDEAFKKATEALLKNSKYTVEGNFGGKLYTNVLFLWAKDTMEAAIKDFSELDEDFKIYNPNFGAKIEGAITLTPKELKEKFEKLEVDKSVLNPNWWEEVVHPVDLKDLNLTEVKIKIFQAFDEMSRILIQAFEKVETVSDFLNFLVQVKHFLGILRQLNPIAYLTMYGSVIIFLNVVLKGLFVDTTADKKIQFLEESKKIFAEMLQAMENRLLELYPYFPL
jgi:hypothetical protein